MEINITNDLRTQGSLSWRRRDGEAMLSGKDDQQEDWQNREVRKEKPQEGDTHQHGRCRDWQGDWRGSREGRSGGMLPRLVRASGHGCSRSGLMFILQYSFNSPRHKSPQTEVCFLALTTKQRKLVECWESKPRETVTEIRTDTLWGSSHFWHWFSSLLELMKSWVGSESRSSWRQETSPLCTRLATQFLLRPNPGCMYICGNRRKKYIYIYICFCSRKSRWVPYFLSLDGKTGR